MRIAAHTYWERRSSSWRLDFRKRDTAQPGGFRYLYLGLWPDDVLNRMTEQLDEQQMLNMLRSQANENAKRYLTRKGQRDGKPVTSEPAQV